MKRIIEVTMDDNSKLYFEADDGMFYAEDQLIAPVSYTGDTIKKAQDYIDGSINQIKTFVKKITSSINKSEIAPDEFELEFSIKLSAEAGIIISSFESEAGIGIKMKWTKEE